MKRKNKTTQLRRYRVMLTKVRSWRDGLGLPIDSGVRKPVALLNLLGFPTSASCEGHLDPQHGTLGPWIDVISRQGGIKKKLDNLVKGYERWELKQETDYPGEFFFPYVWYFTKPSTTARIQIGQEIFEKVRPEKSRIPKSVRVWVYHGKKSSMHRFTAYLWKRYLGMA